jgi:hypothetical protein
MQWLVRMQAMLEMSMNAVERVKEFTAPNIDQEAALVVADNPVPTSVSSLHSFFEICTIFFNQSTISY